MDKISNYINKLDQEYKFIWIMNVYKIENILQADTLS